MAVTQETLDYLCRIARLHPGAAEKESLLNDLNRILEFVDRLNEINTDGVEPLVHFDEGTLMRDDIPAPSLTTEEALRNANDQADGFFRVPKAIG